MGRIYKILPFIIFILLAFVPAPGPPAGGWYQQFLPYMNNRPISDLTFVDSLTGFAVTPSALNDTAYVIKTTNGGNNWFILLKQPTNGFNRVQFLNSDTGFICGSFLRKTINGGLNWNNINTSGYAPENMFVLNNDTMWIIDSEGSVGGVFRTTNGGASWQVQYQGNNPNKIYMYDRNLGFISTPSGGALYRTSNSGENWTQVMGADGFYDMRFSDGLKGYKCRSLIKKTTDGGLTWVQQTLPSGGNIIGSGMSKISYMSSNGDTLWGLSGEIIVGSGTRGTLYHTINGGVTWTFQLPDTAIHISYYYHGIFVNRKYGWNYSTMYYGIHTTNGGDTVWYIGIQQMPNSVPEKFTLKQNYPNPFNPRTVIPYSLSASAYVKIIAYDISGKEVQRMVDNYQQAGAYEVDFMGKFTSTGVYFYRMTVTDDKSGVVYTDTKKMVLIK